MNLKKDLTAGHTFGKTINLLKKKFPKTWISFDVRDSRKFGQLRQDA